MSDHTDPARIDHHITPLGTYLGVFGALMVLTLLTVWVAFFDLGFLNVFVAITIAVIKAALVAWFFMHLNHSARITWIVGLAGVVWLLIMLVITLSDYMSRHWIPYPDPWL